MIRIMTDGKTIDVADTTELKNRVEEIFTADVRNDVTVTYVVTKQPTSRRMTPTP